MHKYWWILKGMNRTGLQVQCCSHLLLVRCFHPGISWSDIYDLHKIMELSFYTSMPYIATVELQAGVSYLQSDGLKGHRVLYL